MVVSQRKKDHGKTSVLKDIKEKLQGETRVWRKRLGALSKTDNVWTGSFGAYDTFAFFCGNVTTKAPEGSREPFMASAALSTLLGTLKVEFSEKHSPVARGKEGAGQERDPRCVCLACLLIGGEGRGKGIVR